MVCGVVETQIPISLTLPSLVPRELEHPSQRQGMEPLVWVGIVGGRAVRIV